MKKKLVFICLLLFFVTSNILAQDFKEKVYKEIVIGGKKSSKWMKVNKISDYNEKGKIILERFDNEDSSNCIFEYDAAGNNTYKKYKVGNLIMEWHYQYDNKGNANYLLFELNGQKKEVWIDYDEYGHPTRTVDSNYMIDLWEYKYDAKGNMIYEKQITHDNLVKTLETWYKYDDKGHKIYENKFGTEYWYEYNNNGNLIYIKREDGFETWYEYEYWENGKVKKQIEYTTY